MILTYFGTGYISSDLTKGVRKNRKTGEEIFTCLFQFANLNYIDPETRKSVYSKFLCEVIGNYGKIIYDNFKKDQKVFIYGSETQRSIKRKDGSFINTTLLHCDKVEFMANPKDLDYETKAPEENIDNAINDEFIETEEDNLNTETFS